MSKEIVVIGGSFGGLLTIKGLSAKLPAGYHITLVEPSTELVWVIGLPRGIVQPEFAKKLFVDVEQRLASYPNVTHIQTYAESVDPATKTVKLKNGQELTYAYLVVASGASAATPWKYDLSERPLTPAENLRRYIAEAAEAIKKADTVVIGGAGPVGIETAGEIIEAYPTKHVILVNAHKGLLQYGDWPARLGPKLEAALKSRQVEIRHSTKVVSPSDTSLTPGTVELSTGAPIQDALYISSVGFKPNSSFLPASYVDEGGNVLIKPTLQTPTDDSIFVVGDVGKFRRKFLMRATQHVDVVVANLVSLLSNQPAAKTYSEDTFFMAVVQLGTWGGAGVVGWFNLPTFFVKYIKGKAVLVTELAKYA